MNTAEKAELLKWAETAMDGVEQAEGVIEEIWREEILSTLKYLMARVGGELQREQVVLEEFDVEGCEHPDALVFRRGADKPYVVVRGRGGDYETEEPYGNVCDAWDAANPRVIEGTTVRWEKEDIRERLRERGFADSVRNVDDVIEAAQDGLFADYLVGTCIESGNEYIGNAIAGIAGGLEEE